MEFKDRLKQYRLDNNLTQDELADKLFVSRQAISKYETGRGYPSIDILTELAKLMGISVDELITSEELTKETLYSVETSRKNKKNIVILAVCVALVVIVSIVSIIISATTSPSSPEEESPYVLIGVVGTLDEVIPSEDNIRDNKMFGYCYLHNGEQYIGKGYNLSFLNSSLSDKSNGFDMNVTVSRSHSQGALYEVYLNKQDNQYYFEKSCDLDLTQMKRAEIVLEKDGFSWRFSFEFTVVDSLQQMTLYEYGSGGNLIKQTVYNGTNSYVISDECLYVVVEERMLDAGGVTYYNRSMIVNSEMDQMYFYTIKNPNANGYCTEFLTFCKY